MAPVNQDEAYRVKRLVGIAQGTRKPESGDLSLNEEARGSDIKRSLMGLAGNGSIDITPASRTDSDVIVEAGSESITQAASIESMTLVSSSQGSTCVDSIPSSIADEIDALEMAISDPVMGSNVEGVLLGTESNPLLSAAMGDFPDEIGVDDLLET